MPSSQNWRKHRHHNGGGDHHHGDEIMTDDGSSTCATIPQDRYEYDDESTSVPTFASDQGGGLSVVFGQENEFEENAAGFNEYMTFTEDDDDDYTEDHTETIDGTSTQETNSTDDERSTFTDDYSEMMLLEDEFDLGLLSTAFTATNPTSLWVDSACSWLEQPMCLLGGMENNHASLLRQSKGRTRAALGQIRLSDALSQSGLTAIAMERRSLRLNRSGIGMSASGSVAASQSNIGDNIPTATDGTEAGSVLTMTEDHIQLAGKQTSGDTHGSKRNTQQKLEVVIENDEGDGEEEEEEHEEIQSCKDAEENDSPVSQDGSRLSPINLQSMVSDDAADDTNGNSDDVQGISSADNKTGDIHHDEDSFSKDSYRLKSSPSPMETRANDVKITVTTPSQPLNANSEDLSESESIESDADSTAPQATDRSRVPTLSKRSKSPVPTHEDEVETEEVTHLTNLADTPLESKQGLPSAPSASVEETTLDDTPRNQVLNGVEVIDLQGMEEQQEWTLPSAMEAKASSHSRRKTKSDLQDTLQENGPGPSFADRRALFDQNRDTNPTSTSPTTLSSTSVNDLFKEEEAKLSAKKSKRPHNSQVGATARLTNPQTAEDLWTEEEKKLHIIPHRTDIFDDPDAREAFLGQRRGQLQEGGFRDEEHLRSTSRSRRLFDSAFEKSNREAVNSLGSKNRNSRRAPTPEESRPMAQRNIHSSPVVEDSVPVPSRRRHISELAAVRTTKDSRHLQSKVIREDQERQGESRDPSEHKSSGRMGMGYHQGEEDRPPRRSKSRDNRERAQNMVSVSNREDRPTRSRRGPGPESWPDYETVISATKELKKLEKKIEKQLRTVRRETRNQDWENQSHVSSKEIRKLEKQLAQKLKRESEKRGAKLKRIKRRSTKKSTHPSEEIHEKTLDVQEGRQSLPPIAPASVTATPVGSSSATVETPTSNSEIATKSFSQKVDDFRERSKFDQLRVLRSSRYLRPSSRGRNKPAPVSDHLAEGQFEI